MTEKKDVEKFSLNNLINSKRKIFKGDNNIFKKAKDKLGFTDKTKLEFKDIDDDGYEYIDKFAVWKRIYKVKCVDIKEGINYDKLKEDINKKLINILRDKGRSSNEDQLFDINDYYILELKDDDSNLKHIKKHLLDNKHFLTKDIEIIINYDSFDWENKTITDNSVKYLEESTNASKINLVLFNEKYREGFNSCDTTENADDTNYSSNKTLDEINKIENSEKNKIVVILNDGKHIRFFVPYNVDSGANITRAERYKLLKKRDIRDAGKKKLDEISKKHQNTASINTDTSLFKLQSFFKNSMNDDDGLWKTINDASNFMPIPVLPFEVDTSSNGVWKLIDNDDSNKKILKDQGAEIIKDNEIIDFLNDKYNTDKDNNINLSIINTKMLINSDNNQIYYHITNDNKKMYKSEKTRFYIVDASPEYIKKKKRYNEEFNVFSEQNKSNLKKLNLYGSEIRNAIIENIKNNRSEAQENDLSDNVIISMVFKLLAKYTVMGAKTFIKLLIILIEYIYNFCKFLINKILVFLSKFTTTQINSVFAGVIVLIALIAILLGVFIKPKSSPKSVTIIEQESNKKTLYSIIVALPQDISKAYVDFINIIKDINGMLFDVKKTADDITRSFAYSEKWSLTDREKIGSDDKKRVDYIMHFYNDDKVSHHYKPKPFKFKEISNIDIPKITFSKVDNTYKVKCEDNEYFDTDCVIKEIDCNPDVNDEQQESSTNIKPPFDNDYTNI